MNKRIGILGGGQLGRMLFAAGNRLNLDMFFIDSMREGPVANISSSYTVGSITSEKDVLSFGEDKDILTIEIEKVNTEALTALQKRGKTVYPQPDIVKLIQDKGVQKQFYKNNNLPTSNFSNYDHLSSLIQDIDEGKRTFPFVQKMRKDGYDGRGVQIIRSHEELEDAFPYNFIVEECVAIKKELAVVTCRDKNGNISTYDPVEMVFHKEANILLYQSAPASVSQEVATAARKLAADVSSAMGIVGLLAVELFLDENDDILINEVAPRPHNSGHHTIESCITSQYENHLRAICNLPLGATDLITKSLLLNVLGEEGYQGEAIYKGLDKILSKKGVSVHLYGKKETKPFRKMGHINIVGDNLEELIETYEFIKENFRVISK